MYIFSSAKNGIWIRKNSFFDFLYSLSPLIQIIFSLSDSIFYALSNEPKKKNVSPPRNGDIQKKPSQLSDWLKKKIFFGAYFSPSKAGSNHIYFPISNMYGMGDIDFGFRTPYSCYTVWLIHSIL